jgi:hypothetical protein
MEWHDTPDGMARQYLGGRASSAPDTKPRLSTPTKKDMMTYISRAIEFEIELTGGPSLTLPPEIASALPATGKATVVVVMDMDAEDAEWKHSAYAQFLADDAAEDTAYDRYR